MKSPHKQRIIVYVDGFNLYFGMKNAGYTRYYWLDVTTLSRSLLKTNQRLISTKYFTARISGPKRNDSQRKTEYLTKKQERQTTYLDALNTLDDFKMYEGQYLAKQRTCHQCGSQWTTHEEKMTDVNIATELLVDAFQDKYDTALLISADSDLVSPVLAVQELYPEKRIIAAFPPERHSHRLKEAASAQISVGRANLAKSQLPESISLPNGHNLRRPKGWQ